MNTWKMAVKTEGESSRVYSSPDRPGLAGVYWSKGWWRWWW